MITPDLITRSNRRTLSLAILKDGQVVVKAPLRLAQSEIDRFVFEKQDWIREKLSQIEQSRQRFDDIINYRKFLLFGNKYELKLTSSVKKVETAEHEMVIYMPKSTPEDKILPRLKTFYKREAKAILEDRMKYLCSVLKLTPTSVRISDSKGRWGACNSRGSISLNFRVIMLEPLIIDYVLIHELCHLVEMNHSKRFWGLVTNFMPQAPAAKAKIKEYGFLLSLF